ncbi:Myb DNA-bind 3 domain-containing protein [Citrus sinensis]|uniref:Myb/SANT-like domain-containing protein n=1 Tax=Citrus clementina TaxID=85681 RepID=V4W3M9_CITCL|nr:hypothetical protein CICLE_v10017745mg [Citrus x clementina]KAH9744252.1 Myb DNA-bind 3 domain-containing protein [Citrus sinensis]
MDPHDVDVEDKADWSSRTKTIFICIVHDHVKKGDLQTSTFTKKIWTNIRQLKSKFNRLCKKHREFSNLIAHTGFGWDLVSNTVTASEAVWAEYIKIFNTTIASGHLCFSSNQVPLSSDEDRELEEDYLGHGVHVNIEDDDSIEPLS